MPPREVIRYFPNRFDGPEHGRQMPFEDTTGSSLSRHRQFDPRQVLLLGPTFGFGGAEHRFHQLSVHLFGGLCDTCVFTTRGPAPHDRVIDLGYNGDLSYPHVIARLRQLVRRRRYRIIVSFGLYPNVIAWIAVCGLAPRPQLIFNEITLPSAEERDSSPVRGHMYWIARRFVYPRATAIWCNSESALREFHQRYRVADRKVHRVPNILDVDRIARLGQENVDVTMPFFVVTSRLVRMKRIHDIVDAFTQCNAALRAELVIVGDGPFENELRTLARQYKIDHRVRFVGWQMNPYRWVSRAMALVSASEYEGLSNSVLEAMCCHVPVISSVCNHDMQQLASDGVVMGFQVGDVAQLAAHMTDVLEGCCQLSELVSRADQFVLCHQRDNAIAEYERLVETYFG